jgi:hypothetical protein
LLLAACRPQVSDFKPLKEGETLDNCFGCFSGHLSIGMGHFKTPEGGKLLSNLCWLLADRNSPILTPKTKGNA